MSDDTKLSQVITHFDLKNIRKMLLENDKKLNMNYRDIMYDLQTPLMRLCHFKVPPDDLVEIIDLMLCKPLDINIQDGEGRTVLSHACIAENDDVIDLLAQCKQQVNCNPNIEDNQGCTPLFYAVRSRNPIIVSNLLDGFLGKGLEIDHADHLGITALQEAETRCDREICHLLKSKGQANISVKLTPREVRDLKQRRTPTPKDRLARNGSKRRKKKSKKDILSPLVVSNNETSLKRNRSEDSMKSHEYSGEDADDEEVFYEIKENGGNNKRPGLTPRERQNSFSLPDLRANSGSLVSSTPSSASFQSDYSVKNSSSGKNDDINEDDLVDMAKSYDSYVGIKTGNSSISLPELQLDLRSNRKHKDKLNQSTPTMTPRLQNINSHNRFNKSHSIDASSNSIICQSNVSISSRKSQQSIASLILPQIDATPRAVITGRGELSKSSTDTSNSSPRKGNNTNRGIKSPRMTETIEHDTCLKLNLHEVQLANSSI